MCRRRLDRLQGEAASSQSAARPPPLVTRRAPCSDGEGWPRGSGRGRPARVACTPSYATPATRL
eukprot:7684161-Pyramimonas_sp.AAC.1